MNKQRRKEIQNIIEQTAGIKDAVEELRKFEHSEDALCQLEDAALCLDDCILALEVAIDC